MTTTVTNTVGFNNEALAAAINSKLFDERMGQNELARLLGMSNSTVCRVVSKRKDPTIKHLAVLLDWLGKKFEDFVI